MEKFIKILKYVMYAMFAALLVMSIALCVSVAKKNTQLKLQNAKITEQAITIDSLQKRCDELGNLDCISVSTQFVVNNKNIMSFTNNAMNNVNRVYATYTRDEVLAAMDSLERINGKQ